MKPRFLASWIIPLIVAAMVTFGVLYHILINPGEVVHELGGDGIKNYFSFLYHASYGKGWWFDGMNYPQGEHILYVDGQPLLSTTLAWLRNWIDFNHLQLNIILNILMATVFFMAIMYVYRILLRFRVSSIWAIVFACLIVPMSMQNFMIYGGYGLAYTCVVPMLFYWFIRYRDTGHFQYIIYLFFLAIIVMLLHPYEMALILVWSAFYMLGHVILAKSSVKDKFRHIVPVLIMVVATVVIFKFFLGVTDPVSDRTEYPHGLLTYGITGPHIFKNGFSPYWIFLQKKGWAGYVPENAGYAYTGLIVIAVLCFLILRAIYLLIRKQKHGLNHLLPEGFDPIWLFVAFCALLFSMGVPFVWGLDFLYDYVASFRQFRALNWFALLFYYVATIYAAIMLYSRFMRFVSNKKVATAILFFFIPIIIWGYETYGFVTKLHLRGNAVENNYKHFHSKGAHKPWQDVLAEKGYEPEDFQAIIHLPFYHVGSEKIWLARSAYGVGLSMEAAYQLHLPIVDANMSRSSWSQTFEKVHLAGGPYTYKPLFYNVKDNRPYLIMYFEYEELNPYDRYFFDLADSLGKTSNMIAYVLPPERVRKNDELLAAAIWEKADSMMPGIINIPHYDRFYMSFNEYSSKEKFFGDGAMPPIEKDTLIGKIDVTDWQKDVQYEASAWSLVNDKNYKSPTIRIDHFDSMGNNLGTYTAAANQAIEVHGMWFRSSAFFSLQKECTTITLMLLGKHGDYHSLDELLIRNTGDTIINKSEDERVLVNNHLLYRY